MVVSVVTLARTSLVKCPPGTVAPVCAKATSEYHNSYHEDLFALVFSDTL